MAGLPQELVDKVVDEFHNDKRNLRICALISRAFVPQVRVHLFFAVILTRENVSSFCSIIASSPAIGMCVRRLKTVLPAEELLPPQSVAQMPNLTHLSVRSDPFGLRRLSSGEKIMLVSTLRQLTTARIRIERLWTLPEWAALLNACPSLKYLDIYSEPVLLTAQLNMPVPAPGSAPRLHTLRIAGNFKILSPLADWLIPGGFLTTLHTLAIDDLYIDDRSAPDPRPPLVLAAAHSIQRLSLGLDPRAHPHLYVLGSYD